MDGPLCHIDGNKNTRNITDWKISRWSLCRPLCFYWTDISKRSRRKIVKGETNVSF